MDTKHLPTAVLVQGSFQIPEVYKGLVDGLVASGYPTTQPKLPGLTDSDSPDFPYRSILDDALAIRSMRFFGDSVPLGLLLRVSFRSIYW